MSPPRVLALKIRRPRPAPENALQRLWGVGVCGACGEVLVLGEGERGREAGLCSACRSLPAAACLATPRRIHGDAQPALVGAPQAVAPGRGGLMAEPCSACTRPGEEVTILELSGEVDVYSATAFRAALLQAIVQGARHVVIDALGVTFLDSTGLGVLVLGERQLRPRGGALAVACTDELRRLLELTGLLAVFSPHSSRAEALAALPAASQAAATARPRPNAPGLAAVSGRAQGPRDV